MYVLGVSIHPLLRNVFLFALLVNKWCNSVSCLSVQRCYVTVTGAKVITTNVCLFVYKCKVQLNGL